MIGSEDWIHQLANNEFVWQVQGLAASICCPVPEFCWSRDKIQARKTYEIGSEFIMMRLYAVIRFSLSEFQVFYSYN